MAASTPKFTTFSPVKQVSTNTSLFQAAAKTAPSKTSGQTVVAFQNMLTISIDEVRKFGTSNFVRVGLYSRANRKHGALFQNSFGVIDQNASPFCSEDSLLEVQPPREHKLAFLAEEYGRNSGKKFTSEATFDFTKLGNQILGQVKAWRVLMGFRNIGGALRPKGSPANVGYYLEFSLPEVAIANKKLQGVIQGLNTKVYDTKNLDQDFGCAVPESVLMSCFSTPKSLRNKPYNPLSNDVLNLGKNLFDFESMIHVGHLSEKDFSNWERSIETFLASKKVNPSQHVGTDAPTFTETLNAFPQFQEVWAVSMHKLNLSPSDNVLAPLSATTSSQKAKQDAKTVQYALYANNNTTRIIQTNSNISLAPNIRSFDLPNLFTNFTKSELDELASVLNNNKTPSENLKGKIEEALAYYRYINQSFVPVGKEVNLEVLVKNPGTEKAKGIATTLEKQVSNKEDGFEMDLGGSFALNLFEKNARIMAEGAKRTDALNFVADDNAKFMDVRLPPAYYNVGSNLQKMPIDYALAYCSNSNVVLIARSQEDPKINVLSKNEFEILWNKFNANEDFKSLRYNFEAKTPPLNGFGSEALGKTGADAAASIALKYPGLSWADKIKITRTKITPSRMILDSFYKMINSYLNLYGKFWYNDRYKKVDLLDPYEAAIIEGLLNPEYPLFKTPFNLQGNRKFVSFTNAIRGVLFNKDTLFKNRDFKKSTKNIKNPYNAFKHLKGTAEFLAAIPDIPATNKKEIPFVQLWKKKQNAIKARGDKKATPNLALKSYLIDPSFFSNTKDPILPQFLPYTSGKSEYPKEINTLYNPKLPTPDAEFVRSLPAQTNTTRKARITQDSSSLHNVPALIPFIKDGSKYWADVKKQSILPCITPKVFDPFQDKKDILDALVFYHRAAENCGSLLCNADIGRMKDDVSVKLKAFLLNPYTGDVIKQSNILKDVGLDPNTHQLRLFESTVQLRKEFYAIRFLALLGSYFSRAFDKNVIQASPMNDGSNKGFIVYEDVFGSMCNFMLNDFAKAQGISENNLNYLLIRLGKKDTKPLSNIETGNLFSKLVFGETTPFTKIIKETFGKLQNYKFQDSRTELLVACSSSAEVDQALKDADLLAFIVDSQKFRDVDEGTITPEAYELARRFYCGCSPEERNQLKLDAVKFSGFKTQATVALLNPDIVELDEETKKMICSTVGKMRIMDVKSDDAFIRKLKEVYHNSDEELQAAFQKLACDKISVSQNIQAAEQEQEKQIVALQQEADKVANQEDDIANKMAEVRTGALPQISENAGNITLITASAIGLGIASYFGYKYFTKDKNTDK